MLTFYASCEWKHFYFLESVRWSFSVNVLFIRRELSGGRRLSNGIKDKLSPHRGEKSLRRMHDNRADELERRSKWNLLLHKTNPPGAWSFGDARLTRSGEWINCDWAVSPVAMISCWQKLTLCYRISKVFTKLLKSKRTWSSIVSKFRLHHLPYWFSMTWLMPLCWLETFTVYCKWKYEPIDMNWALHLKMLTS